MPGRRRYPIADDAAGPIPPPLGPGDGTSPGRRPKVQVYVPWKAMLIVSIGLTVAVNLVALLAR